MGISDVETSRLYALEKGGASRLELRWRASFRQVRVLCDGKLLATLERRKMPKDGATVMLPDGSTLSVRLSGILGIELLRDGVHLPESDLDPRRVLCNASFLMALAAAVDGGTDGALLRRVLDAAPEAWARLPFWSRPWVLPLALDATLLAFAVPTFLGSRAALAVGIAVFAARFGLEKEHATWTLIYGVIATWVLATHFFATFKRRRS